MVSIWEKETFFAPQDVIIIGSGFVGLWSAFFLKKKHPQRKITVIERGLIPTGASTRNAGFACFGSLSELIYDGKAMGTDKMLELVEMRYRGLERIQKYFDAGQIDYEQCGGYELYEPGKISAEELHQNIAYLNSLLKPVTGSKNTYRLVDEQIDKFGFGNTAHLVENRYEGYQHSGKLLQSLLHRVQGMGVQVLGGIEITGMHHGAGDIELQTRQAWNFSARQVLICTNAFTKDLVPDIDIIPARGQVLLTSHIDGLPFKGTFHSDEGFYYFRNLGKRILVGGARNKAFEDEATTEMNTSDFLQSQLEKYLSEVILPGRETKYTIEYRWAGIMAMGSEKMPIVKQIGDNVFCAVRMSGMGVALAPVVAKDIAGKMS